MDRQPDLPTTATTPADPGSKRELILEGAIRLFAERGYADTDVEAISTAAGVAKGTIYRYFKNKEDLFVATVDTLMRRLVASVFAAIADLDDPVAIIRTAWIAAARFCQDHPELIELMVQQRASFQGKISATNIFYRQENYPFFEEVVRQGIRAGRFREVDPREVVRVFASALQGIVISSFIERDAAQLVRRVTFAVDLLLAGLDPR